MKPGNLKIVVICMASALFSAACGEQGEPIYLDPSQPVEKRVSDLLNRMTLEEKVGQMSQYVGLDHMRETSAGVNMEEVKRGHANGFYPEFPPEKIEEMAREGIIGSFLHVLTVDEANYLQSLAEQSRLKIPLIIGIDAIHGNGMVKGTTVYPTPITQAASFNPALVEQMSRETALEMRATGSQWTFTPNVEVARDARWGRFGESFGEDPLLVGRMGAATIRGLQTEDYTGADKVIACAKHLLGGGQPINGINGAPFDTSERTMREIFLPPFKECVDAGVATFMPAHNEYNGIPCHANKYLITDVVRGEWGFDGFFVSDWMDIERLEDYHRVVATWDDAFELSLNAGVDVHMHGPEFYFGVLNLVRAGRIPEKRIDRAVQMILEAKFRLGLFENRYIPEEVTRNVLFNEQHQATALEAARQGIVLLKNDGLLPIDTGKYKRILVTGPNCNNQSILGDWASEQPGDNIVTIWEGLQRVRSNVRFSLCDFDWNIREMKPEQVKKAVDMARENDLAIVVVGENSMRYHWNEKTNGENTDRYDLDLYGLQQQLVEEIYKTGTPVVVVLASGRPNTVEWIAENVPALVNALEPGAFGGQAIAEILFGDVNPSAKLPMTMPRHSGQIQTYYNYKLTSKWFPYATGNSKPLYEFGHGLSYTSYRYGDIKLSANEIGADGSLKASVEVTNTGNRDGVEIVQMYITDEVSSATRPIKELKDFERVELRTGQTKTVEFTITPEQLAYYDADMKYGVEPGVFTVAIGTSSRDEDLTRARFNVN